MEDRMEIISEVDRLSESIRKLALSGVEIVIHPSMECVKIVASVREKRCATEIRYKDIHRLPDIGSIFVSCISNAIEDVCRYSNSSWNRWAVVTDSPSKAMVVMQRIENNYKHPIADRIQSKNAMSVTFCYGVVVRWARPIDNFHGFRIGKMWCDRMIDPDFLDKVIMPMYTGREDDIEWV